MYYSVEYPVEELETLMERHPLGSEEADDILGNIRGVEFTEEIAVQGLLLIKGDGKYFIKILKSVSEEEQKKSAVHGILHFDYKVHGTDNAERLLEEETERIYKEHPRLTNYIFERVKSLSS